MRHLTEIPIRTPTGWCAGMPHITLMRLYARENHEPQLVDALKGISSRCSPFEVSTAGFDTFSDTPNAPQDILVLRVQKSHALARLHERLINTLSPFIDRSETTAYVLNDPNQRHACERYGSPFYGTSYAPHITLARIDPTDIVVPAAIATHTWTAQDMRLSKKIGEHWVAVRRFPFTGS